MKENKKNQETLNKDFKEPKIRFKQFSLPYTQCKLCDVAVLVKRKSDGKVYPIMMISSIDGFINQGERYSKDNAGTSKAKYTLLYYGELSYNHGNSKTKKYGSIFALKEQAALIPFVYHSFKIKNQNPFYFARYLNLPMHDRYLVKVISSGARMDGLLNISSEDFFKMPIQFPGLDEQNYIETFFDHVDCKISILNRKIKALKKYRKGLTKNLLFFRILIDAKPLNGCCKITTGKLDANAMKPDGKYKFFTCSKEDYLIDNYAFDCEAILVAGNGEVGYTKYYKGKFNAYQRTYVLYNFKTDPFLIKTCIDLQINSVIRKETNKGTMPYIKLGTFSKIKIPNIDEKLSCDLNFLKPLNKKIFILEDSLKKIKLIKQYLLKNLFI